MGQATVFVNEEEVARDVVGLEVWSVPQQR